MDASTTPAVELLALRVLPTAIRGRLLGTDGVATYRRSLDGIVPGQRLTISVERRWRFRRTDMIGGTLLHAGFSLSALGQAGFGRPLWHGGLACPGDGDQRLARALSEDASGWAMARCLLLDVLEEHPGNLQAHARLGDIHAMVQHLGTANAHWTAAIRLGLAALTHEACLPLDASRPAERALLGALVARASLMAETGRQDAAASDLRRALAWDPTDACGARPLLERLEDAGAPACDFGAAPAASDDALAPAESLRLPARG